MLNRRYPSFGENIFNPDPTIPMVWGGPTTMEMMIGYISFTNAEPSDNPVQKARSSTGPNLEEESTD